MVSGASKDPRVSKEQVAPGLKVNQGCQDYVVIWVHLDLTAKRVMWVNQAVGLSKEKEETLGLLDLLASLDVRAGKVKKVLQAKLDSQGILDRQGQREIEGVMEILDLLEPVAQLAQRVTQVLMVVMGEMESQEDKVFLEEMDFKVKRVTHHLFVKPTVEQRVTKETLV